MDAMALETCSRALNRLSLALFVALRRISGFFFLEQSQVVLTKDIDGLGKANAVVTVKNGYYLNYLHPRQMASLATSEMLDKVSADAAAQVGGGAGVGRGRVACWWE